MTAADGLGVVLAGPGALNYRAGTYASFLAEMQGQARRRPALATLNLELPGDFTNALMSGWARVCDVLTFYQERIANEGYLSTAVEPASIVWLAAEIGEGRNPAVGARTNLALQLIDAAGQPASLVVRPGPSLAVQSTPASPKALPVIFECAETRELRPAWNALAPVAPPVPCPPALWPGCRSIRIVGTGLGIRPGGALLLRAADGQVRLAVADTVQVDRALGCTMTAWRDPAGPPDSPPLPVTAVTQFERSAGLFGRAAMDWADVPLRQKQAIGVRAGGVMMLDRRAPAALSGGPGAELWTRPSGAAPPPGNIQALLGLDGDGLLAGTSKGIYRSTDRGASWQPLVLPQPKGWHDVLSLHRDEAGTLYAGTAAGVVLTSSDGGEGWAMLTQTVVPEAQKQGGLLHILERPKQPDNWTLLSPVHAILTRPPSAGAAPDIYIGTDQGVFAMRGDVAGWQTFNGGLPGGVGTGAANCAVEALALVGGSIVAAANRGLFIADPSATGWREVTGGPVECTSLAADPDMLYVGSPTGVFALDRRGAWSSFSAGLGVPPPAIAALLLTGNRLYAATGGGLFTSDKAAPGWTPLAQDLTLFTMDRVFAEGLDMGAVSPELSQRFALFGIALDPKLIVRPIFPLGVAAVTRAGWELCSAGEPPLPRFRIYAEMPLRVTQLTTPSSGGPLALLDGGMPAASVPLGPVLNGQWPDFAIATGAITGNPVDGAEIYLDRKIDEIEEGSLLVLAPAGSSLIVPEVHEVLASETILHKAYGRQGIVTRIVVAPTVALLAADPRTTDVYLVSRPLAPFTAVNPSLEPLAAATLTLSGVHADLAPGRSLQVSGPRPGAVIVPGDPDQELLVTSAGADNAPALDQQMIAPPLKAAFAAAGLKLSSAAAVQVITTGSIWLVRDGDQIWLLRLPHSATGALPLGVYATTLYEVLAGPDGLSWLLRCGDEEIRHWQEGDVVQWQRAASTQASFSEVVTIDSVTTDPAANITVVALKTPLTLLYDSALARICANVVLMTQGETVASEVLGSGQLAPAGQSFTLHHSPLTYTQDQAGYGVHADLTVQVNGEGGRMLRFGEGAATPAPAGERWAEIRSLALSAPADRVFSLTTDDAGRTTLHFGNGVHGARLPSGNNNVTATYRAGAGAHGNVPAGSLIVLRRRPPGIRSATNPAPASGGGDAETCGALRLRAPRKLLCCDRIVTLGDYQAYAKALTGVGQVQAVALAPGIVWLTIVTADWQPISGAPALRTSIRETIMSHRADTMTLRLEDPALVPFDVALSLRLAPGAESPQVKLAVRSALTAAFGPAARAFGQPVHPQEVEEAASAVPGVQEVQVAALNRSGTMPGEVATLVAAPVVRDATGAIAPVEWLVIDAARGIRISVDDD